MVCTLCSCVMQTKRIWLFSAHLLPLVARLCLVPLETIVFINKFSMIFTGLEVIYFLASNLLVPYNLAKTAYRELAQVIFPVFRFTMMIKQSLDPRASTNRLATAGKIISALCFGQHKANRSRPWLPNGFTILPHIHSFIETFINRDRDTLKLCQSEAGIKQATALAPEPLLPHCLLCLPQL